MGFAKTTMKAPILIAEDDDADVFLLRLACERAGVPNPLVVAADGREAIRYLQGEPPFSERAKHPLPALFLLDLKMPILDGFDVLEWVGRQPDLKQLPVIILSSSGEPRDREKARALGACDYIVKPGRPEELYQIMRALQARWLS